MKKLTVILFMASSLSLFAQTVNYKVNIPIYESYARSFAVLDAQNDTVMKFNTVEKTRVVAYQGKAFVVSKQKEITTKNGDIIAHRKRKQITFPKQNVVVTEKKSGKNWTYSQDGKTILEVSYAFDKASRMYKVSVKAAENNEIAMYALQICLDRFDTYVWMDRPARSYYIEQSAAFLAAIALIIFI